LSLADYPSLIEKAEQVDRLYLLIGKVRFVIVVLPLERSGKMASVVSANEQVDSNKFSFRPPATHTLMWEDNPAK